MKGCFSMSNLNRKIIESRDYKDLYRIELFNTGFVIVFRKTDDNSTGTTSFIGREADQGYTVVLKITNFLEHYNSPLLEQIVDLFEKFIQHAHITVDSQMYPILFDYQHTHFKFLYTTLKETEYSDLKKWCVLASSFQEFPSFATEKNSDFLFSIFEQQMDPEEIKEWNSIQESANYVYPNFPNNGKIGKTSSNNNNNNDVRYSLLVKDESSYKDYIAIINLLKNAGCKTLENGENLGFTNFTGTLSENEIKIINFYLKRKNMFNEHSYLTLDDLYRIETALHQVPVLNSELSQFVIQQILSKDLSQMLGLGNKGFFLPYDQYLEFSEIAEAATISLPQRGNLNRPSTVSLFSARSVWNFWIMMSKLFSEIDRTVFIHFLNEWIELLEEETNGYSYKSNSSANKLTKVSTIKQYFDMLVDSEIPVRYLWYLHGNDETSMD